MLHRHCFQRAISRLFLLSGDGSFRALHPARASAEPLRASRRAPNAIRLLNHPEASENAIYDQQSSEQSGAQHLPAGRMRTPGSHPWAPWVWILRGTLTLGETLWGAAAVRTPWPFSTSFSHQHLVLKAHLQPARAGGQNKGFLPQLGVRRAAAGSCAAGRACAWHRRAAAGRQTAPAP